MVILFNINIIGRHVDLLILSLLEKSCFKILFIRFFFQLLTNAFD
jgi:hypothetical protein